jgi:hypothetical protein
MNMKQGIKFPLKTEATAPAYSTVSVEDFITFVYLSIVSNSSKLQTPLPTSILSYQHLQYPLTAISAEFPLNFAQEIHELKLLFVHDLQLG